MHFSFKCVSRTLQSTVNTYLFSSSSLDLSREAIVEHAGKEKKTSLFFSGERFGSSSSKETNNLNKKKRKRDSAQSILRRSCKRLHQTSLVGQNFVGDFEGKGRKLLSFTRRREIRVGRRDFFFFVLLLTQHRQRKKGHFVWLENEWERRLCETGQNKTQSRRKRGYNAENVVVKRLKRIRVTKIKEYSKKSVERVSGRHKNNNNESRNKRACFGETRTKPGSRDFGCDSRKNSRQQSKEAVEHLFRLVGKEGNSTKKGEPW
nr:hypothetical protein [Tanacetum cinerariifolium]